MIMVIHIYDDNEDSVKSLPAIIYLPEQLFLFNNNVYILDEAYVILYIIYIYICVCVCV